MGPSFWSKFKIWEPFANIGITFSACMPTNNTLPPNRYKGTLNKISTILNIYPIKYIYLVT